MSDDTTTQTTDGETPTDGGNKQDAFDLDAWLSEQPEDLRTKIAGSVAGLKKALTSERDSRKSIEKALEEEKKANKTAELQSRVSSLEEAGLNLQKTAAELKKKAVSHAFTATLMRRMVDENLIFADGAADSISKLVTIGDDAEEEKVTDMVAAVMKSSPFLFRQRQVSKVPDAEVQGESATSRKKKDEDEKKRLEGLRRRFRIPHV